MDGEKHYVRGGKPGYFPKARAAPAPSCSPSATSHPRPPAASWPRASPLRPPCRAGLPPQIKGKMPHPVPLEFFDPFNLQGKMTPAQKEKSLLAEINNGRLAMLGIFGVISASKGLIVPGLDTLPIPKYAGEYMAPLAAGDAKLPFVQMMLDLRAEQIAREAVLLGTSYPGA